MSGPMLCGLTQRMSFALGLCPWRGRRWSACVTLAARGAQLNGSPDAPAFCTRTGAVWTDDARQCWWKRNRSRVPHPQGFRVQLFRNSNQMLTADTGASELPVTNYLGQFSGNKVSADLDAHCRQNCQPLLDGDFSGTNTESHAALEYHLLSDTQ